MPKRVLVVDDDVDIRETTRMILSGAGYEILEAASRQEAEQQLATQKVDLIILDVMLETDTEGFHLAYKMRQDAKLKRIPIIVLTCIEEKTGQELTLEESGDFLPVDVFLRKPLDPDELKAEVARLLK